MPVYEITSPQGEVFEITAPEGASEQEVLSYAKSNFTSGAPKQERTWGQFASGAGDAAWEGIKDSLTFGGADELQSAIAATVASPFNDQPWAQNYNNALESFRTDAATARENFPVTTFLGNIAGAIPLGVAGASAASKVPALASLARTRPYTAAAGGAFVPGALYGYGSGEGGDGSVSEQAQGRGANALFTGALSSALALPLTYIGRNVGQNIAKSIADNTPSDTVVGRAVSPVVNNSVPDNALSTVDGGVFPMTAGQRTQKVNTQQLERGARGGSFGPEAREAALKADAVQNKAFKDYMTRLAGKELENDILGANDILDGIVDNIRTTSKAAKDNIRSAYQVANAGKSVKISRDDLANGLIAKIAQVRRDGNFDLTQMPNARNVLNKFRVYAGDMSEGPARVSSVRLGRLEQLRTQATQASARTVDPTEKAFLRSLVKSYDDFMSDTAASAASNGDADAINAFKSAVSLRAKYGRMFEDGGIVEAINDGASVDDVVRDLIGSGTVLGRKGATGRVNSILNTAADPVQKDLLAQDLRHAYVKRMWDNSLDGYDEGDPNSVKLAAGKFKQQLDNMFIKNRDLSVQLFGKDAVKDAQKALVDLNKITKLQPQVYTPSGPAIERVMFNFMQKLPGVNLGTAIMQTAKQQKSQVEAIRSFEEIIKEVTKPKWPGWSAVGATVSVPATAPLIQDPLRVTVRPSDKLKTKGE